MPDHSRSFCQRLAREEIVLKLLTQTQAFGVFGQKMLRRNAFPHLRPYAHLVAAIYLGKILVRIASGPQIIRDRGRDFCQFAVAGIRNELRLDRSRELLTSEERSVSEIAAELGYSSPSNFSRAFKAKTGLSPIAYRNSQSSGRRIPKLPNG